MPQAVDRDARDLLAAGALIGVRGRDRTGIRARAPISSAVRIAVPEGESTLPSW